MASPPNGERGEERLDAVRAVLDETRQRIVDVLRQNSARS